MFEKFVQARETFDFPVSGTFLYIMEAPASGLLVKAGDTVQTLYARDQISNLNLRGSVTVQNLGDAGWVRVRYGFGQFEPSPENMGVKVREMPPVAVESLPGVAVKSLPAVAVKSLPGVAVESLPAVSVEDLPPVKVSELPRVKIENGQAVAVYAKNPLNVRPVKPSHWQTQTLTLDESGRAELDANAARLSMTITTAAAVTAYPSADDASAKTNGLPINQEFETTVTGGLVFVGDAETEITITEFCQ
ncbi:hypothetical protein BZG76_06025 [Salinivibrio sp. AR647]|uniref:hypothetical protein n=1 Tax=Salinivibrio sp. AR647 TaxID=1909438 RepID=UPI000986DAAE|nr:hypothetical protein [Salinivibrio sp. AR647]OOE92838.1 hypothetical protein BZG76_06025 [Salinivibrio sp. AR647]